MIIQNKCFLYKIIIYVVIVLNVGIVENVIISTSKAWEVFYLGGEVIKFSEVLPRNHLGGVIEI